MADMFCDTCGRRISSKKSKPSEDYPCCQTCHLPLFPERSDSWILLDGTVQRTPLGHEHQQLRRSGKLLDKSPNYVQPSVWVNKSFPNGYVSPRTSLTKREGFWVQILCQYKDQSPEKIETKIQVDQNTSVAEIRSFLKQYGQHTWYLEYGFTSVEMPTAGTVKDAQITEKTTITNFI
jgi:hypothetical protein